MEVKSIYMDLVEGKKKGNVWKLESEAFKKPIEIKIWYENKELAEFKWMVNDLKAELDKKDKDIENLYHNWTTYFNYSKHNDARLEEHEKVMWRLWVKLEEKEKEISQLYKVIADLKTTVETLSGTILHLQEQTSLIQKKITKQPMVFHDKWFISWRESSGLWMINIPDGDYLLIAKYVVGEHNEYVTNQDEILMDKIHVEGQHYVPFYKLEWGTELDTPTATIYYDLVFMPI